MSVAIGVFRCSFEGCPQKSCIRRGVTGTLQIVFETLKPETHCPFFIGPDVWTVLRRDEIPHKSVAEGTDKTEWKLIV
jgi:hypothetical protein